MTSHFSFSEIGEERDSPLATISRGGKTAFPSPFPLLSLFLLSLAFTGHRPGFLVSPPPFFLASLRNGKGYYTYDWFVLFFFLDAINRKFINGFFLSSCFLLLSEET